MFHSILIIALSVFFFSEGLCLYHLILKDKDTDLVCRIGQAFCVVWCIFSVLGIVKGLLKLLGIFPILSAVVTAELIILALVCFSLAGWMVYEIVKDN